ncbi:MAG: hypothetical protein E6K72_05740 [Candidatus Eisenbacteria bacterium]|uniref:Uncharacterized protein n=1 Tax=Eiseniibacteriota bacterium TaxID=2212470 RepID=A0A538SX89_UNCEI|nr:MAG: hypothetical protein E6K72_05740 [Candidatus Eisenbacteria bacterium]
MNPIPAPSSAGAAASSAGSRAGVNPELHAIVSAVGPIANVNVAATWASENAKWRRPTARRSGAGRSRATVTSDPSATGTATNRYSSSRLRV